MNNNLLQQFRNLMNQDDYIIHSYHSKNTKDGKRNQWNIICSAMDWIEVAVEQISLEKVVQKRTNEGSISLLTFIMCVSILTEAVQQLHRVFIKQETLFKGEKTCFSSYGDDKDDNERFETIRAIFAAHPTNLHNDNQERFYAGWSSFGWNHNHCSAVIYSNIPGHENELFDVNLEEVIEYAEKRYAHLATIMKHIQTEKEEYYFRKKKEIICLTNDSIRNIDILLSELKNRLDVSYYRYELLELKRYFQTDIHGKKNQELVNKLKLWSRIPINIIHSGLQNMTFDECPSIDTGFDKFLNSHSHYYFSKLSEYMEGCYYPEAVMPFSSYIEVFSKEFKDEADFAVIISYEELYVVVMACLLGRMSNLNDK